MEAGIVSNFIKGRGKIYFWEQKKEDNTDRDVVPPLITAILH